MIQKYWKLSAALFLVVLSAVYVWNNFHYTTNWAYDGGGHIDYVFTVAREGRLPAPPENYLAWHEPLYYALNGMAVRGMFAAGISESTAFKMLEIENALLAVLFVAGAGTLAWLVLRRRSAALAVLIATGSLFAVSALARYVTNEMLFHTAMVWWLCLFYHWKMYDVSSWTVRRWAVLAIGLSVLLWIKLSALVVVFAVFVWLAAFATSRRGRRPLIVAVVLVFWVAASYSPWLLYKQKVYGEVFTINNVESAEGAVGAPRMPLSFFFGFDTNIFRFPFYTSGNRSFWSMLYGSALGDYDNIFQNYDSALMNDAIRTSNGRFVPRIVRDRILAVYRFSIPLALWVAAGLIMYLYRIIRERYMRDDLFLALLALGFLTAQMYNVYRYPFLERGTLKAIFILTFFPLAFMLAFAGWQGVVKNKTAVAAAWVYFILWSALSVGAIILPV